MLLIKYYGRINDPKDLVTKEYVDNAASGDMSAAVYDPDDTVAAAGGIPDYVSANGSKPKQVYVNLSATWSGTGPYTQVVTVSGVTANSEVSFRPNAVQLQQLIDDGVQALYVENDNGTCTAVAVGAAPSVAMKLVSEVTEVVPAPPLPLNDYTWSEISAISQAGTGANYWAVGDTKQITLNGTVGTKTYSNVSLCVFIVHFNMPRNKTVAENNIIWQGFKTALTGGVDVALDDDAYNTTPTSGTKKFAMNHTYTTSGSQGTAGYYGTNYGGWKGTDLRYDILGCVEKQPSQYNSLKNTSNVGYDATQNAITSPVSTTLMAAIPSDFRAALRLWERWVDNTGNKVNTDDVVTACVDAGISILAEFEVQGARTYANQYEQDHQVQCAYYAAGNSKIKYKQSSTGTASYWWCSSASYNLTTAFCLVYTSGTPNINRAVYSLALAPAFKT